MRTFGIDVSHWEGSIDWQTAAPTLGFAYFKCTDGLRFIDSQFQHNQHLCNALGIAHAPYHYFQPALDPTAQADHFIATAGKEYHRYIVDVEAPERVTELSARLLAFLQQVEKLTGVRPAIYTSSGYWSDYVHPKPAWAGEYDLVIAQYSAARAPMLPPGWTDYVIWQFTEYWNIPGCQEEVNGNWFNGSLQQCRDWFGNYRSASEPPAGELKPQGQPLVMYPLFDNLNIRQSPNMQARIVGKLTKDELVKVEQVGGVDVWVRHARGWSAVERGGYRYMEVEK